LPGGDHTRLALAKDLTGQHRLATDAEAGELIRALAPKQPDAGIAAIFNGCGKRTGKGNTWTESRAEFARLDACTALIR
jgi:hypothetical protein